MQQIPDVSFSHIGLFVFELDPMVQFYTRILGFYVTDHGVVLEQQRLVFLSRDPCEHHQIVLVEGRTAGRDQILLNQISLRVANLAGVRAMHARVSVLAEVSDVRAVNHVVSFSVYFRDPEGNRIEVFCDSPFYVAQPHIEPLDLALADAEIIDTTAARYREDPTFCAIEEWRQRFPR